MQALEDPALGSSELRLLLAWAAAEVLKRHAADLRETREQVLAVSLLVEFETLFSLRDDLVLALLARLTRPNHPEYLGLEIVAPQFVALLSEGVPLADVALENHPVELCLIL